VRHTIVTLSRGDAHKIGEWVDYHARLGFEDFQVVLDGDVDGTAEVLRGLDVPADITIHARAEVGDYYEGLPAAERRERVLAWRERHAAALESGAMRGNDAVSWRQHLHLPEVMAPYAAGERGRGWLAFIDVDEFIVLTTHGSIAELTAEATAPRLRFLNFNVDTTGHDPGRPVLEQHSVRWSREDVLAHPLKRWAQRCKSIVRYRCAELGSSVHRISRGRHAVLDPEVARLHHFKVPVASEVGIAYTVDDPVRLPG
jgi:Glycosyl transferase family 2